VPPDGRTDTCTAGAGTLLLEFGVLSRLSGDPIFESVARRAMFAIWELRDKNTGLVGSTIDLTTGLWIDKTSSLGAGAHFSVSSFSLVNFVRSREPIAPVVWYVKAADRPIPSAPF
jgi:hypothetical protein